MGTGASGLRLLGGGQHLIGTRSSSSRLKKTGSQRFHARSLKTIRLPVFTICAGIAMKARRNVVNSIRRSDRFASVRASTSRPRSGSDSAIHAFRLQARDAMTMYAQLLASVSTGADRACMSLLRWAKRFS